MHHNNKQIEIMTTTENKVSQLEQGFKIWDLMTPMERYNKVMVNFTPAERKGVNGLRKMVKYIIDNEIN